MWTTFVLYCGTSGQDSIRLFVYINYEANSKFTIFNKINIRLIKSSLIYMEELRIAQETVPCQLASVSAVYLLTVSRAKKLGHVQAFTTKY